MMVAQGLIAVLGSGTESPVEERCSASSAEGAIEAVEDIMGLAQLSVLALGPFQI